MISEIESKNYIEEFCSKLKHRIPIEGQVRLTYRCNYHCIHCYCAPYNNARNEKKELKFLHWQDILNQTYELGGIFLTITGGEPLLHKDFLKIYNYARNKGFLVTIFTNGFFLDDGMINHLVKNPPFNIEITLNGITKKTYESITQVANSFEKVIGVIKKLVANNLPLALKTNGLRENKNEILKIKGFTERLLGKGKYSFDSYLTPSLDGSFEPVKHRLTAEEILEIEDQDSDMVAQRKQELRRLCSLQRPDEYLYHCNSWTTNYLIDPYGLLQFCHLTRKYSTDLTKESFKKGFYKIFPELLKERYKSDSKCVSCKYKDYCFHCPARANLETGNEEAPVEYFCQLAKANWKRQEAFKEMGLKMMANNRR